MTVFVDTSLLVYAAVGYDGVNGHGARVGMAQDLFASGATLGDLCYPGRWSSPEMPARYTETLAADRSAFARYQKRHPS